jgi:hypothetical protein
MATSWISKSDMKLIGGVVTALFIGATIWKIFSPDQKCPTCDRIITASKFVGAVCPVCAVGTFKV